MPQYAVIVYSPAPADPMALAPEYLERIDGYAALAKELGGKVLGGSYFSAERGFAFEPSTSAKSISGETVSSGPLVESDLVVAALFVLSARDIDTAVRIAQQHPAVRDGGVEVRPLYSAPGK
ncbi:MAG: YciI family protein [Actinobacteria bacterium]|nr:YciI family protein [Actinomycetota bacterium]MCL5886771.1 YciI family protein [Actinomycetota bacterium]